MNKQLFKKLAQVCIDSYEGRYGEVKNTLKDVRVFQEEHVKFFVGDLDNYAVICFPGSLEFKDWVDDLTFKKAKWYGEGEVHSGFKNQFDIIFGVLDPVMTSFIKHGKKIIIVGHSLGGALATLATDFYVQYDNYRSIILHTEGSPRVGDGAFTKHFNANVKKSYRIVNGEDIVTKVPFALPTFKHIANWIKPFWMNYRHVKGKIKIGQKLSLIEKLLLPARKIFGNPADHYPQKYLENICLYMKEH